MKCPNCKSNDIEYWVNVTITRVGKVTKTGRITKLKNTGNEIFEGSGYICQNCQAKYRNLEELEKELDKK